MSNNTRQIRTSERADKNNAFVKQAAILMVAGFVARLIGFSYRFPLTQIIGDEGNGVGGVGHTVFLFFFVMSSAGFPWAISKMVAERVAHGRPDEARRVFHTALVVAVVLGAVSSLILFFGSEFIVTYIMRSPRGYYSLLALTPTVFFVAIVAVFRGYFLGMQNAAPSGISQIIEQIFNAVFSVLLAVLFMRAALPYEYGGDPIAMGAAGGQAGTSVGAVATLIFILIYYFVKRRSISKTIDFYLVGDTSRRQSTLSIAKELVTIAIPFILGTAIFTISSFIDMAMVVPRLEASGILDSSYIEVLRGQLVGKYVPITNMPASITLALATAVLPSIVASVVKREYEAVTEKINTALRLSMLITIPIAVGIGVLANPILMLLFPANPDGGMLLAVGSASMIGFALYQIFASILQATGRLHIPVIAAFIGAMIKIPLNYYLIAHPDIRIVGAVISTTACYTVAAAVCWYFFNKHIKFKIDLKNTFFKPSAAALIMGLGSFVVYHVIYFLTARNAPATIIAVLVGMVMYTISLLIIGGLRKSDVRLLPMGRKIAATLERLGWIE